MRIIVLTDEINMTGDIQTKIEQVISKMVGWDKAFTASEIIDMVGPVNDATYHEMRDYVHNLYFAGWMGIAYLRTSVTFESGGPQGKVQAFVYHPKWKNPNDYKSHKVRDEKSPLPSNAISSCAADSPPISQVDPSSAKSDTTNVIWFTNGNDPVKWTGSSPKCSGNFTVFDPISGGPVTATNKRPLDASAAEIIYSFDAKGRIVLGPTYTARIGAAGDTVYGIRERKRFTIVKAANSLGASVIVFTIDSTGNLRIPHNILEATGVKLPHIEIELDDDAIYIKQPKK